MNQAMLFKKFLLPCGLCAAVPAMKPSIPAEEHATPCANETQVKKLIKPSELPMYATTDDGYSKQMPCSVEYPSFVEENVRKVRRSVGGVMNTLNDVSHEISHTIDNLKFVVDYLQDEVNVLPRMGAVGIGGLSGLILGMRGGYTKRIFYASSGAAVAGLVCFPKEAKESCERLQHYGNIGYNFICGVKPGDSKKEISLKNLPLVKDLLESEYVRMLTQPFKHKEHNAKKMEENEDIKEMTKNTS